ncbi:MAG: GrdX family protein [Oscillospiraceae bacterium]
MDLLIITNNPLVNNRFKENYEVELCDCSYSDILIKVRDLIHAGHKLLSHPLSGSIKPNETPYKTILVTKSAGSLDFDSLRIIEDSILTCRKFGTNRFHLTEGICEDFMLIDLSLISGALSESTKV